MQERETDFLRWLVTTSTRRLATVTGRGGELERGRRRGRVGE